MGKSVRIKAPNGKMVVCRERRTIGRLVRTRAEDAHLYELMDETEALDLEAQWQAEDKAKAKDEAEAGQPQP